MFTDGSTAKSQARLMQPTMADITQPTADVVVLKPGGESTETWTEYEVENYCSARGYETEEKKGFQNEVQ